MWPPVICVISLLGFLMHMPDTGDAGPPRCRSPTFSPKKCPGSDWYLLDDNRCMKINKIPMGFDDAERYCRSIGGGLLSILSRTQLRRVICYTSMDNAKTQAYWVGAKISWAAFQWTDESKGIPFKVSCKNGQCKERCLEINYREWGRRNDQDCTAKRPSVCVKRK